MEFINKKKKILFWIMFGIVVMGIICYLLYVPIMQFLDNPQALKKELESYGVFGGVILALIMSLQVIFVFLPGEIVEVLAGFVYGPVVGMFICLLGATFGSMIIYMIIKKWGSPLIDKLIGKDKLKEVSFLKDEGRIKTILFIIFLIPGTPKDIITYIIPLTNMKLSTFLIVTTVARIPSIISSTIGGNAIGLEEYKFSVLVFVITGLCSLIGLYFYKYRIQKIQPQDNL